MKRGSPSRRPTEYADDLQAAYDYYKSHGAPTAGRFLTADEKAVETLEYNPYIFRKREHGWLQMIIKDYPNYSIFHRELPKFGYRAESSQRCAIPTLFRPDF